MVPRWDPTRGYRRRPTRLGEKSPLVCRHDVVFQTSFKIFKISDPTQLFSLNCFILVDELHLSGCRRKFYHSQKCIAPTSLFKPPPKDEPISLVLHITIDVIVVVRSDYQGRKRMFASKCARLLLSLAALYEHHFHRI